MPIDESYPRPYKFTNAQFDQLGDMGWFEGRRPILLDGMILEQGPMSPLHACGLGLVYESLRSIFATGWVIRPQFPLHLSEFNDPVPDIAVVKGEIRDFREHPKTAPFIIEVSDSTLDFDMTRKKKWYAEAGIADYWILDLIGRRLLVYRDPDPATSTYRSQQAFGSADHVSPLAAPPASILVADLLP